MTSSLARQAGLALLWRGIEHAGIKGIYLARVVILARLLAPEDFGLLVIATIGIDLLLSVTDLGLTQALVQRAEVNDRQYNAAWTAGMIRAAIIAGLVVLAAPLIAGLFAEPRATLLIQVLAIRPLLDAARSIRLTDLTRSLHFRSLTFVSLLEALVSTVVAVVLARSFGVWALVAGAIAGSTTAMLLSYCLAPYCPRLCADLAAVRPLVRYGRWIFVRGIVVMAGGALLQLVISRQLGTTGLGLYSLAARLAFLPHEVAGQVVGSVAFPLYARLQLDSRRVSEAYRFALIGMAVILIPIYTLIIALAPTLVEHALGPQWSGTASLIQLLALVGIAGLLGDATGPLLQGLGYPGKVTLLSTIQNAVLVLFAWDFTGRFGLEGAALAWLPAVAISQVLSVRYALQLLDQPFSGLGPPLLAIGAATGVGALTAYGATMLFPGVVGFACAAVASTSLIACTLWLSDHWFGLRLTAHFARAFPQLTSLLRLAHSEP